MVKRSRTLTNFGKDLDSLLKQAGKFSISEYADECGVSYKYILQLRTTANRRPGRLYVNLLKPFIQLRIVDLVESHQLSLRHRGKPLSLSECSELFPDTLEKELLESIEQAIETERQEDILTVEPVEPGFLYRRVFVGREAELKLLQSTFDNAMSGNGSIVMVVGEPGIGKTALWEQLSAYVATRGGKAVVGHCYEEGSLKVPYLALIEAIRSYVVTSDLSDVRKVLGTDAADVARIVSEVREKLRIKPRPPVNPEEDRYRLFQAVTGFLSNAATTRPLLVVLEDLHNADKDTLEMLIYVARNLGGTRLMIVGTYRDVEVNRMHPLSATLAELRRIVTFDRVLLRGLDINEVNRMLENIAGEAVPKGLTEAVHHQTEGNPLFVQEVIRYLIEIGIISREKGHWFLTRDTSLELSIPEGLRDVIGRRLSRLSAGCNRVLSTAAVIGREFPLEILHRVAGVPDDEIFTALEEAKASAIIEEHTSVGAAVSYRFMHALIRQTLYEDILAPRRARLHQHVGRALEEVDRKRLEEHATELAEHFSYSSDPADLSKAVNYGEMAAQQASSVYAYGETVRLLEQALRVQEVLDPEDKEKRCDLLLVLCATLIDSGDPRRVVDKEAREALSLAKDLDDSVRVSRVCEVALGALSFEQSSGMFGTPETAYWIELADHYAKPGTRERVLADCFLASAKCSTGHLNESVPLLKQALDLARHLGDPEVFWITARTYLLWAQAPQHAEEQLHLATELMESSRAGLRMITLGWALPFAARVFLRSGNRRRAEEAWSELQDLAERTQQANPLILSMSIDISRATLDGRLEEAVEIVRNEVIRGQELGIALFANTSVGVYGLRSQLYLARNLDSLERAWLRASGNELADAPLCLVMAHLNRVTQVEEVLQKRVVLRPGFGSVDDETMAVNDIMFLEAAVLVGHRKSAELLLRRLAGSGVHTADIWMTCTSRHLGAASALLGIPEEARNHYQEAIKVCTEMRFRPELALTRLQLAELLLEHYPDEKPEALEHLDFAINEFCEMDMQPSLERTLRQKEILGA
ncbi:MAG: AAA family ATPase [Dehalococcoidales bacterium]|nr:MAG: AAA family ATPase [Dehalococcoidales bacterium]